MAGTRILTGGLRWITFRVSAARPGRLQAFAVGAGQWLGQVWRKSASGGGCMAGTLPGPRSGLADRDIGSTGVLRAAALAGAARTTVRHGGAPGRQPDARQHRLRGGVRRRPADRGCGGGRCRGLGARGDPASRRRNGCRGDQAGRRDGSRHPRGPAGCAGHSRCKRGILSEDNRAEGSFRAQAKGQWREGWRDVRRGGLSGADF
jgi:hypothetical protein